MTKDDRPLPQPNSYMPTQPFWDAAHQKRLVLQRCDVSGRFQHPPRPVSVVTGRRSLSWQEVPGTGTLYSWTVTHSAWPGHEHRVPYICAYVQLDEGPRLLCNLVNCQASDLKVGMKMRVAWEQLSDDINYPAFMPLPNQE